MAASFSINTLPVNHSSVRITRDEHSGEIADIEVLVTAGQRSEFIKNFEYLPLNDENSCYTFILQNCLAKYQEDCWTAIANKAETQQEIETKEVMGFLRLLSEEFSVLESLINNASYADSGDDLQCLKTSLQQCEQGLLQKIKKHTPACLQKEIMLLQTDLTKRFKHYHKTITEIEKSELTHSQVHELFSLQAQSWFGVSVGDFICETLYTMTNFTMERIYSIQNNRFAQLFHMHSSLKALSDAKALLDRKGKSLYFRRYNNTRSPVPAEQVASLKPDVESFGAETKWMSLTPFLGRLDHLEKIEDIVCFLEGETSRRTVSGINPLFKIFIFIAALSELPLVLVHVALSLVAALCPKQDYRLAFTKQLSDLHNLLSPLRYAKAWANQYYRLRSEVNSELIKLIQGNADSKFNQLINAYASPEVIFSYVKNLVVRLASSLGNIGLDGLYAFFVFNRKKRAQQVTQEMLAELAQADSDLAKKIMEGLEAGKVDEDVKQKWAAITGWESNEFSSFWDFIDEMLVGLSDVVVSPMFRKSPGLATLFFFLSASFVTVMALPAPVFVKLGATGRGVETLLTFFSKQFTGRGLEGSVVESIFSAFLFWKTSFFISEAVSESMHGDFRFLESVFGEAETMTLALMFLMLLGVGMQYVPHLQTQFVVSGQQIIDPISATINMFTLESKHCAHGQFPLTGIEYAFLGGKSMLLLYSLASGSHTATISPLEVEPLVKRLTAAWSSAQLFEISDSSEREAAFIKICNEHNLPVSVIENLSQDLELLQEKNYVKLSMNTVNFLQQPKENKLPPVWQQYDKSRNELLEAQSLIKRMEFYGKAFPTKVKAMLYYDHLDEVFDQYNAALRGIGRENKQVDKSEFLHIFYSKYCYSGSSNAIKLITLLVYPLTCVWRLLKAIVATQIGFLKSPAITHQIKKSFSKELAILIQPFAFLGRYLEAIARSLRNVFQLKIHKINLLMPLGPIYSWATSNAGTITNLQPQLSRLSTYLEQTEFSYFEDNPSLFAPASMKKEESVLDRSLSFT